MLYGTRFLPDYPQARLKLGRFRGTSVMGDILDNKQEHIHAFGVIREAMAFLDRTLPLSAHFVEGRIEREDRLPVPPDALREILLNAVMHRDYSDPGSYVAIAVFDDRIEIRSIGRLPAGITIEALSGPHLSKLRNPLIAETFHRTGAVEIWGRGTNRVIEQCERYGIDPPTFEEQAGGLIVTFRAPIGPKEQRTTLEVVHSARARKILAILEQHGPLGSSALLQALGEPISQRTLQTELGRLRKAGLITSTGKGRATRYRAQNE
jgi:ATP-dependent DNA helicase RecG